MKIIFKYLLLSEIIFLLILKAIIVDGGNGNNNINEGTVLENSEEDTPTGIFGTVLFDEMGYTKKCFSQTDIALLSTRKEFDAIIPIKEDTILETDKSIEVIMEYFYSINEIIQKIATGENRLLTLKSFYDVVGGYMNNRLIPATKLSYYSGELRLQTANYIFNLFNECKIFLNTNGNGWSAPITNFSPYKYSIEPIKILDIEDEPTPCINLVLLDDKTDSEDDVIVALPKIEIEDNAEMSNIWLPYKRKHIFNLKAESSAFIVLRYFVDVSKCYKFQNIQQEAFNLKIYNWIKDVIVPRLFLNTFYPGFGAVLRILETIKNGTQIPHSHSNFVNTNSNKENQDRINDIQNQINEVTHSETSESFFGTLVPNDNDEMKKFIIIAIFVITTIVGIIIFASCFMKVKRKKSLPIITHKKPVDHIEIAPHSVVVNGGSSTTFGDGIYSSEKIQSKTPSNIENFKRIKSRSIDQIQNEKNFTITDEDKEEDTFSYEKPIKNDKSTTGCCGSRGQTSSTELTQKVSPEVPQKRGGIFANRFKQNKGKIGL